MSNMPWLKEQVTISIFFGGVNMKKGPQSPFIGMFPIGGFFFPVFTSA